MAHDVLIAPSILSADFAKLGEDVKRLDQDGADWIHIDVMDGHFVPNLTFGPPVVKAIRGVTRKPFDVHLMITPVDPMLEAFAEAGADRMTVHAEAGPHLDRSLQVIRGLGKKAGVAINPATPPSAIEWVLDRLDLVLVMTVNPGFGGQAFIEAMIPKIAQVSAMLKGRNIELQVDGGIHPETAGRATRAGAQVLVAGSAVFATPDYARNIKALRTAATSVAV